MVKLFFVITYPAAVLEGVFSIPDAFPTRCW